VLEGFADGEMATSEDAEAIQGELARLLDDEARLRFGAQPLPAVRLQIEQLRARFGGFARWQAGWVAQGWRIERAEAVPAGDGVAFDVDGVPILLRGKIDRVDRNDRTGEWCVLDYKTSEGGVGPDEAHRRGRAGAKVWVDLQLPLYRRLVPALQASDGGSLVPGEAQESVRVGYVLLSRDAEATGEAFAEWTVEELTEAEEVARGVVRFLRKNHFVFQRDDWKVRAEDPLAAVVGGGVLRLEGEEDDDSE
jgi:ATP-dependent helicase/nuclease subunit B